MAPVERKNSLLTGSCGKTRLREGGSHLLQPGGGNEGREIRQRHAMEESRSLIHSFHATSELLRRSHLAGKTVYGPLSPSFPLNVLNVRI